jgi:hypothetical protein
VIAWRTGTLSLSSGWTSVTEDIDVKSDGHSPFQKMKGCRDCREIENLQKKRKQKEINEKVVAQQENVEK